MIRTPVLAGLVTFALAGAASAQQASDPFQIQMERQRLEQQRIESRQQLRVAIDKVRDARRRSCQFSGGAACTLAQLSTVELLMMDVSDIYAAAEASSNSAGKQAKYRKVRELSEEIGRLIDELSDLLNRED